MFGDDPLITKVYPVIYSYCAIVQVGQCLSLEQVEGLEERLILFQSIVAVVRFLIQL